MSSESEFYLWLDGIWFHPGITPVGNWILNLVHQAYQLIDFLHEGSPRGLTFAWWGCYGLCF